MQLDNSTGVVAGVVLLLLAILAGPVLFIWSINTLAEAAGVGFHIAHGVWSYLASLVLLGLFAR